MEKRILVYCWDSISEPMTIRAMKELGYGVLTFHKKMKDYHADAEFAQEFITFLHAEKPDMVFSYDYFPLLSMICQMNGIPYAAWIYDCPMYTLLSGTIGNACNRIFCFDEAYALRLQEMGAANVYHFPLGSDTKLYVNAIKECQKETEQNYRCDISFVGSLYNDEKNRLTNAPLGEYEAGYVEGLIRAQQKIYGYNLLYDSLPQEVATEIADKCGLKLGDAYMQDSVRMAADVIGMEVTSRERMDVLSLLAERFPVTLYSNSRLPDELGRKEKLKNKGTVDYAAEMPLVFHNSKINLNITSRTIETGIPQRVLDILACGGFCLTNWQKEIADLFEDGRELVMYTGMEDLMQKVEYYLAHDEETERIARARYEKVSRYFDIKARINELIECVDMP